MPDKEGFFTRLARYVTYGVLLAFMMYLFGMWYQHGTIDPSLLNRAFLPVLELGGIAGTLGGSFVMGIEALVGLVKSIWRGTRKQ